MSRIFHIASAADWSEARRAGWYAATTIADEGFIHCSKREQVLPVADAFFRGCEGLVLLDIDTELLGAELRLEDSVGPDGETDIFPHVYGPIEVEAVVDVRAFPAGPDGRFAFPLAE